MIFRFWLKRKLMRKLKKKQSYYKRFIVFEFYP